MWKYLLEWDFSTKMFSDYVHTLMGTKTIEKFRQLFPHNMTLWLFFTLSKTKVWKRRTKFTVFAPGKLSEVHFRTAGSRALGASGAGGSMALPPVLTRSVNHIDLYASPSGFETFLRPWVFLSHISNVWSAPLTCFRYDSFNKEQRRTVAASVSGQSSEFLVGRKKKLVRRQMDCEKYVVFRRPGISQPSFDDTCSFLIILKVEMQRHWLNL